MFQEPNRNHPSYRGPGTRPGAIRSESLTDLTASAARLDAIEQAVLHGKLQRARGLFYEVRNGVTKPGVYRLIPEYLDSIEGALIALYQMKERLRSSGTSPTSDNVSKLLSAVETLLGTTSFHHTPHWEEHLACMENVLSSMRIPVSAATERGRRVAEVTRDPKDRERRAALPILEKIANLLYDSDDQGLNSLQQEIARMAARAVDNSGDVPQRIQLIRSVLRLNQAPRFTRLELVYLSEFDERWTWTSSEPPHSIQHLPLSPDKRGFALSLFRDAGFFDTRPLCEQLTLKLAPFSAEELAKFLMPKLPKSSSPRENDFATFGWTFWTSDESQHVYDSPVKPSLRSSVDDSRYQLMVNSEFLREFAQSGHIPPRHRAFALFRYVAGRRLEIPDAGDFMQHIGMTADELEATAIEFLLTFSETAKQPESVKAVRALASSIRR